MKNSDFDPNGYHSIKEAIDAYNAFKSSANGPRIDDYPQKGIKVPETLKKARRGQIEQTRPKPQNKGLTGSL